MSVNSTHPDYTSMILPWLTMRDVLAGEEAVKRAGIRYLPRLDSQSDAEYLGYKSRACFFNATARTCDEFLGLFFHRDPEMKLPEVHVGPGAAGHWGIGSVTSNIWRILFTNGCHHVINGRISTS